MRARSRAGWAAVRRAVRAHPLLAGALAALALALVLQPALAADLAAQAPRVRDTDLEAIFRSRQQEWLANAQNALFGLFGGLLVLEISYSSLKWQKERVGIDHILYSLVWKIGAVAVLMFFFRYPHLTTERVIDAFAHLGGMIAGRAGMALTPTEIVMRGGEIAQRLVDQLGVEQGMPLEPPEEQGLFTRFSNWVSGIYNAFGIGLVNAIFSMLYSAAVILLVAIIVLIAYFIIALQLLLVKLEAILVLNTAIVFVPFGSFSLTAGLARAYFRYALEVAVRFFFLQVIAGVGYDLFETLYDIARGLMKYDASRGDMHWVLNPPFLDWQVAVALTFAAVAFAYLAWKIPGSVGRRFPTEVQFGPSDGGRAN
jgi:P-type conjugative transfer protein TrbL